MDTLQSRARPVDHDNILQWPNGYAAITRGVTIHLPQASIIKVLYLDSQGYQPNYSLTALYSRTDVLYLPNHVIVSAITPALLQTMVMPITAPPIPSFFHVFNRILR